MAHKWEDRPSLGNSITPMDDRGEAINEPVLRQLLRYMSDGGTTVFIGGPHATEFVNVDRKERLKVWEISLDELGGKGPVNAIPFGPASTTELVSLFKLAQQMGFDGAQLYPGAQDGRGNDGLFIAEAERYYRDVLEAVDFPLYLCGYHGAEIIDSPTKRVPHDLLIRLVRDYPHIVGVTIMAEDDDRLKSFLDKMEGRRPVRLAGAHDWYAAMELGIHGFHSIQQSIAPRLCSTMMAAFHAGDRERAKVLSAKIKRLNDIIHGPDRYYPRSLKPALKHLGFDVGIIRRPYMPLPEATQRQLRAELDGLDLGSTDSLPG
ncbi:MAG: dihydrodipicolinate synthase family protein [Rhodospirillales bacterium]|nr:dihydrodipicolinate synthase family protein [Rhodospirillales bacterium]